MAESRSSKLTDGILFAIVCSIFLLVSWVDHGFVRGSLLGGLPPVALGTTIVASRAWHLEAARPRLERWRYEEARWWLRLGLAASLVLLVAAVSVAWRMTSDPFVTRAIIVVCMFALGFDVLALVRLERAVKAMPVVVAERLRSRDDE